MRRRPVYRHEGFRQLAEHFYQEMLRRDPLTATWLGEHQYDGLLPEVGAEAVEKEIAFYRAMRDRFNALPERELSLDERLDRAVMLHLCEQTLFLQEDLRRWRLGSDLAMTIGNSLFLLFVRDFAPLAQRMESIVSRLKAVPMYLMAGRTLFQDVPPLWGELFLESAARLPDLLDAIATAIKGQVPAPLQQDYANAAAGARKALEQFQTWFRHAIMPKAHGDWALGSGPFQALLQVRRLGFMPSELRDLGDTCLRRAQDRLDQMAHRLVGSSSRTRPETRQEAFARIRSKRPPTFEHALEAYRDAVARSRAFVEMTKFATLPEEETLEIVETPSYMAHLIPFAAYLSPERTARPQKGIYLVTRHPGTELSRHSYADISNTSVHEGYPGHHLQLSLANLHPSRLRVFASSVELTEGWALYCEEAMKHRGFEATEENLFVQTADECWRAARVLLDVNLHQKTWTFDQGLQFLIEQTQMSETAARAELHRYTMTPGYPLSYLVGKHLLQTLKEDLHREFAGDFTDREFHDLVLGEGSLPLFLGREFYPQMLREILRAGPARQGS